MSLARNLLRFGRLLRELGVPVTSTDLELAVDALELVDLGARREVHAALRAVLARRREHLEIFDRAFALFWSSRVLKPRAEIDLGRMLRRATRAEQRLMTAAPEAPDGGLDTDSPWIERRVTWSARERLRRKDWAELSDDEEREVRRLLAEEILALRPRRTRRRARAARGTEIDLRTSLRRSLPRGGEAIELALRRRKTKRRPLVVLCDISGSMEVYSRLFLQFLYALRSSTDRLEVFAFGTRLTRLTAALRDRRPARALRAAAETIVDWGGGTRIGSSLAAFNREWGPRVLGKGAVVLVISDGWDRGDVDQLEREMARLRRRSRRLIWLNPLLGSPGYEPLTRGIRTVLPWVDDFLPLYNLVSLEQLARHLEALR